MKPSGSQKSISLPTALLAAFTGVAFFWVSISSDSKMQSSSVPVSFVASPRVNGPVYMAPPHVEGPVYAGPTLTEREIINAGQIVRTAIQKLKSSLLSDQIRRNGFDCFYTTALEDARGNLLAEWKPMPAGMVSCLVRIIDYSNGTVWYMVIVEGHRQGSIFQAGIGTPAP
jgi:hypothetical protein